MNEKAISQPVQNPKSGVAADGSRSKSSDVHDYDVDDAGLNSDDSDSASA